ncbi:hypothetical protein QJS10_CPB14g01359 [Acorus calamus]|uniref:Uncharacterized protein n=1 Tax=Acorus calamus TaxID=4465 RepID=A0AAV9DCR6_ACOCL|nr:hypothetical protein QJS10_CPB14g01359 [Acorus calamus]
MDVKNFLKKISYPLIALVETKVEDHNALKVSRRILPHYKLLNPISRGRIWLLWNNSLMNVKLLSFSNQYIHCKIIPTNEDIPSYFLTVIYASNSSSERNSLWGDLEILAGSANLSKWMVGGDFNEVRYAHEKLGGRPPHTRRLSRFNNCIEACHLQDLWGNGSSFSWCNNQDARIACKLDRVLINLQ